MARRLPRPGILHAGALHLAKLTFQIAEQITPPKRTVTPAAVTVDPPPFAFDAPGDYDVSDIKGRLTIDGGSDFENNGDQLIVHNQQGQVTQGSLTTATVPLLSSDQFQVYTSNSQTIYVATSPDFHLVSNGLSFLATHKDGTSDIIPINRIFEFGHAPSGATANQEDGQVYGSVEEKYLATLGIGVTTVDLLHAPKSGGVFQIQAVPSGSVPRP